jgi:hypothetical protein
VSRSMRRIFTMMRPSMTMLSLSFRERMSMAGAGRGYRWRADRGGGSAGDGSVSPRDADQASEERLTRNRSIKTTERRSWS